MDTNQNFASEKLNLIVKIPLDKVNIENLNKLLDAKGELIKKALNVSDVQTEMDEEHVAFPWFTEIDAECEKAYMHFIAALCEMSKNVKRVNATKRSVENEKYAFRCFLLRLGFIGTEFKEERKILLKNLKGSSAFRNGGAKNDVSK